jgi:hypothetical protein
MPRRIQHLSMVWAALAAALFAASVQAQDAKPRVTHEMLQQMRANAGRLQQLEQISANRAATIASLMSKWQPAAAALGYKAAAWAPDFQAALNKATDGQLLDLFDAPNYEAVRALLQSRSRAAALAADSGTILDLGGLASDLTFTPVNPPCRIFDTRNYGGGVAPTGGTQRDYQVYGSAATISAQGGNPAGCPAPAGEPVGIAANFTAVPLANGHLRVFPYGGSLPTVSFLNFTSGVNIANAGIVSTCYLCGFDLSVYNAAQAHHIADVMGYFYPAKEGVPGLSATSATTYLTNNTCTNYSGGTVTITTPGSGYVTVTAQAMMGFNTTGGQRQALVHLGTNATDCPFQSGAQGFQAAQVVTGANLGFLYETVPVSRTIYVGSAGTYTYYLNGQSPEAGGSTNVYFWYAAMQARYSAR